MKQIKFKFFPLKGPWPDKNNRVANSPIFRNLVNKINIARASEDAVEKPPESAKDEE